MPSASFFSAITDSPNEINNRKSVAMNESTILCMIVPSEKGVDVKKLLKRIFTKLGGRKKAKIGGNYVFFRVL